MHLHICRDAEPHTCLSCACAHRWNIAEFGRMMMGAEMEERRMLQQSGSKLPLLLRNSRDAGAPASPLQRSPAKPQSELLILEANREAQFHARAALESSRLATSHMQAEAERIEKELQREGGAVERSLRGSCSLPALTHA